VAYLLHARTVEPQKPQNTVHYATIDKVVFSPVCAAFVARQCCEKHISAAATEHATVKKAVFSMCPALMSPGNSG
jgi:hypothetical protein